MLFGQEKILKLQVANNCKIVEYVSQILYCFKAAVLPFHLLVLYIQNPPNYFVEKLHHTHYRGSDDDKSLCRILISRNEVNNIAV